MVIQGVLEKLNDSEWVALPFDKQIRTKRLRFLSEFRNLNSWLNHNPFPMLNIGENLFELKVFKYAT